MVAPAPAAPLGAAPPHPPVYDPQGPTLTCPHCRAAETTATGYWQRFRPLVILGRFTGQLYRVFTCQECRGRFAPLAEVPATQHPPRDPDPRTVYDGAQIVCPKCGQAEARLDPRGRWQFFRTLAVPPEYAAELATVYRCIDCNHAFAPRVRPGGDPRR